MTRRCVDTSTLMASIEASQNYVAPQYYLRSSTPSLLILLAKAGYKLICGSYLRVPTLEVAIKEAWSCGGGGGTIARWEKVGDTATKPTSIVEIAAVGVGTRAL
jgi:hypothetical protein